MGNDWAIVSLVEKAWTQACLSLEDTAGNITVKGCFEHRIPEFNAFKMADVIRREWHDVEGLIAEEDKTENTDDTFVEFTLFKVFIRIRVMYSRIKYNARLTTRSEVASAPSK